MPFFGHLADVFHWKIFAMFFLGFISGEWHWSLNIIHYVKVFQKEVKDHSQGYMLKRSLYGLYNKSAPFSAI